MLNLFETAKTFSEKSVYPFHMPGHKRNPSFIPEDLLSLDITEIPGMDNLHNPKSVIAVAQQDAANIWGADYSFLLVNGSSGGIIATVMSICGDGDVLLAARNSHSSLHNSLIVSGASPTYVMPEFLPNGLVGGISPEKVEHELQKNKRIKAVFITSPTYEGFVSDIKSIAQVAHKYGKCLIVDEAHGAHFAFSEKFPETAVALGADVVIQSLHKTLPTLGQSAILHVKGNMVDWHSIQQSLSIMQTTSPSYMLMCVMQHSIERLSKEKILFANYTDMLERFRQRMSKLNNITLLGNELKGKHGIFNIDSGKLVFTTANMHGDKFAEILREKYRIEIEATGQNHIIAMTSVADTKEGFEKLATAIIETDIRLTKTDNFPRQHNLCLPKMALVPRKAWNKRKNLVTLNDAIGMISAENIAPYPPGIPIVSIGEIITEEIVEYIKTRDLRKDNIYVIEDTKTKMKEVSDNERCGYI